MKCQPPVTVLCSGADRSGWSSQRLGVYRALLLDVAYQPVDILRWSRAVAMDYVGKAEVLDYYEDYVRSAREVHFLPAVMRLGIYVEKAAASKRLAPTRRNVFLRDNFQCQYCGEAGSGSHLTLDHVVPVSKGGADTWENLTTACPRCNQRKGDALLEHCGLELRRQPEGSLLLHQHVSVSLPFLRLASQHFSPSRVRQFQSPLRRGCSTLGFPLRLLRGIPFPG